MVVDTSALIAILLDEPESRSFIRAINNADSCNLSVATMVEASIVILARRGEEGMHDLDRFICRAGIKIVAVDAEQGHLARMAFARFGKGRHRASLNLGDCFSYALAIFLQEPLLCKGNDFVHSDVDIAQAPSER